MENTRSTLWLALAALLLLVSYGSPQDPSAVLGLAKGAGAAGGVIDAVPKCDCPEDHSCDDQSFDSIAGQLTNAGMLGGLAKGFGGGGGALAALGAAGRRRRRRRGAVPGLDQASQIEAVPGASYLTDPGFQKHLQGKFDKCDENTKKGGAFDSLQPDVNKLASGDFNSAIGSSYQAQATNVGELCKKSMNTERDKCNLMKRQCCAILKGQITDASKLSCSAKDMLKTAGSIQSKDQSCDTAKQLSENPKDAGNILQNGGKGIGTGLVANGAADKVLG